MSFKFNFNIDDNENIKEDKDISEFDIDSKIDELPSKYIDLNLNSLELILKLENENVNFKNNKVLKKLVKPFKNNDDSNSSNNKSNDNSNNYESLLNKTDLIPGVYEGGFKLWECAIDVINYLIEENIDLNGKRVLEIGCGHGLPGIFCLNNNSIVTFQDYNEEVIYNLTQPNLIINSSNNNIDNNKNNSKFISGDWKFVDQLLKEEKFDIILTSDTLYNIGSFKKLHNLISNHLNENGKCYLASKTYYFGVGGGIRKFEELVNALNTLNVRTVRDIKDGFSNVREVVEITKIN